VASDAEEHVRRRIDAIWRIEAARVVAALARVVRDVGVAEDLAQDALVAALETWPRTGVPENPGAWLTATGRHRAIDRLRRARRLEERHEQLARDLTLSGATVAAPADAGLGEPIEDDVVALVFTCCHPALAPQARVALTLRAVAGLQTPQIARAFLVPEPTVAQRIVRAKRTLAAERVPFAVPERDELAPRLASVLEVVYLVFNEGHTATAGEEWFRAELCEEALRLGRVLAGLVPGEPEVHGLVALMELQAARLGARSGPAGEPVLLREQDRSRWDRLLIGRGLAALARAEGLGRPIGPYTLQAAIAAAHATAPSTQATDWIRIAALYAALAGVAPSPVVELNRAVALGMAFGPAVGLEHLDAIAGEPALRDYHLLPSVRGDLLARLGRPQEAAAEFARAAALARNARERDLLLARAGRPTSPA
jgi:RNA polymerase sigma factor (sigma-70 family)